MRRRGGGFKQGGERGDEEEPDQYRAEAASRISAQLLSKDLRFLRIGSPPMGQLRTKEMVRCVLVDGMRPIDMYTILQVVGLGWEISTLS